LIDADSPAEHLHDLRKDAKKLRYLVECFATAMPGKLRRRYVTQLKDLQDNLGQHQDAEVHADELAAVAAELAEEHAPGDTLVALGALTARLEQSQREARAEFTERFSAFDSPHTEEVVGALVDALER
jgi:CHAD domain-containing protein